jgi:hypothetical protein
VSCFYPELTALSLFLENSCKTKQAGQDYPQAIQDDCRRKFSLSAILWAVLRPCLHCRFAKRRLRPRRLRSCALCGKKPAFEMYLRCKGCTKKDRKQKKLAARIKGLEELEDFEKPEGVKEPEKLAELEEVKKLKELVKALYGIH